MVITCDSDIEPEDLIPEYLGSKAKLLELSRSTTEDPADNEMAIAKLEAKIRMIENDVLFDRPTAEFHWREKRIALEQQLAAAKKQAEAEAEPVPEIEALKLDEPKDDDINDEAERIAAEILAEADDMDDIGGLFDSLPQNEVDPATGKSQTVINSADGVKLFIKDFGKWTGVGPRRVLEEACRSRSVNHPI